MYCVYCGRSEKEHCIHQKEVSRLEVILLFFFVMATAAIVNVVIFKQNPKISAFNVLQSGSISLSIIISTLLILYYTIKKNYISVFFGCHQKKSRSLHLKKKHFVLCARCTGIVLGIYGGILFSFLPLHYLYYLILAIPLMIDGIRQAKTSYTSTNTKRLITGFLFGPALAVLFGLFHYLLLYIALQFV